jgi:hypothetical protein
VEAVEVRAGMLEVVVQVALLSDRALLSQIAIQLLLVREACGLSRMTTGALSYLQQAEAIQLLSVLPRLVEGMEAALLLAQPQEGQAVDP